MTTTVRFFGGFLVFVTALVIFYWRTIPYFWRNVISGLAGISGLATIIFGLTLKSPSVAGIEAIFFGTAYETSREIHAGYLSSLVFGLGLILFALAGCFPGLLKRFSWTEHILFVPLSLSVVFLIWRLLLEKTAAPSALSSMIGMIWLPPAIGVFLAFELTGKKHRVKELIRTLAMYAWLARSLVAVLMVTLSFLKLGSHYDISAVTSIDSPFGKRSYSPNSFRHHLELIYIPQLLFWPLVTIVAGWLCGGLVFAFTPRRR